MQDALSEADRYQGDPWPDANSVGNLRGCAPPPRRSGQLADYYPLIAQAVNRLEQSTAETRRTIYDRARAAMVAQLRGVMPALNESDITRERLSLEEAIRKVETEAARRSRTDPPMRAGPVGAAGPSGAPGHAAAATAVGRSGGDAARSAARVGRCLG